MNSPRVFAVAVLYLSLAVSVLGRPDQPSSTSLIPQKSSFSFHFLGPGPFTQERRILKRSRGGGFRSGPVSGGGGGGGGRGGRSLSRKVIIIISCTIAGAIVLLAALLLCYNFKKTKHPNWRLVDVFKRKKPAGEKLSVDSEEHKMALPLDHTAKSRQQYPLSHELK